MGEDRRESAENLDWIAGRGRAPLKSFFEAGQFTLATAKPANLSNK